MALRILLDSGANNFAFINTRYIINIAKFFNLKTISLLQPISIRDYNNKFRTIVTHVLRVYLIIDGR
jgi:hypothetical protein